MKELDYRSIRLEREDPVAFFLTIDDVQGVRANGARGSQ